MRNFYDAVAVDPGADDNRIEQAFRNLANIFDSDLNLGDAAAGRRSKEICRAYATLKEPGTRATCEPFIAGSRPAGTAAAAPRRCAGLRSDLDELHVLVTPASGLLRTARRRIPLCPARRSKG